MDLLALVPEIQPLARTTTRLHPRPGHPDAFSSHIGGPLAWPADEPWPTCTGSQGLFEQMPIPAELAARLHAAHQHDRARPPEAEGMVESERDAMRADLERVLPGFTGISMIDGRWWANGGAVTRPHPAPNPMVAVAQLRATDIPDLDCPANADLLQVLWCPTSHTDDRWLPQVQLRWRRTADVTAILAEPPRPHTVEDNYVPRPCVLYPEQVIEYPDVELLPPDLEARVPARQESDPDDEPDYQYHLSVAPGWKVGGWVGWSTSGPRPMDCPTCGQGMDLLIQIDSSEWDGGTGPRWQPVEDRHLPPGTPDERPAREPTGIVVGRWGALRVFACRACPDTPFALDLQ